MAELPVCRKCTHYYITYDYSRPYGCRAMRFKSKRSPALVVYESSGMICQLFEPKVKDPGSNDPGTGGLVA